MADDGIIRIGTEVDISGLRAGMQQAQQAVVASTSAMDSAYQRLASTTAEYSVTQANLQAVIRQLVTGQVPYTLAVKALTPALIEQSSATKALQASKAALAQIEKQSTVAIQEENAALVANTLAQTEAAAAANTLAESSTLARASAGLAGREVGGFLGAQLGKVAATSETLAPLFAAAFPVAGAFALGTIVYNLYESFDKMRRAGQEAADNIANSFQKMNDEVRAANDSLLTQGDRLESELDKLLKRPGQNGISIAFDEAAAAADRLSVSIDRDLEKLQQLVSIENEKNSVGFWKSFWSGSAQTGDTQKTIADAIRGIQQINQEHSEVVARAAASGDKDNLAQAQMAQLVALQEAYKKAEGSIAASLKTIEDRQYYFKQSGIGKDQTDNLNLLRGALAQLAAEQQNIGENFRNSNVQQQLTPARDSSEQQRLAQENARKAAEAERKAQEEAIQAARQGLDERKSVEDLSALQEAQYWESIASTTTFGSKLYTTAVDQANKALAEAQKQNHELLQRVGDEMTESWNAATRAADEAAKHQDQLANALGAAADRITAAQQKASESIQEASLHALEASGGITKLGAAHEQARIHAQAYREELERLDREITRVSSDAALNPTQRAQQVGQLQAQKVQVQGQAQTSAINDQAAIQQQIAQPYLTAFNQINQGWLEVQNRMLFSTRNLGLAFAKMGQSLLISVIDNGEKAVLAAAEHDLLMLARHQATNQLKTTSDGVQAAQSEAISQGSQLKKLAMDVVGLFHHTATNTAKTTSDATSAAASTAAALPANVAMAQSYAAVAAAGAMASVAAIPLVGWTLAPGVGAATLATGEGFAAMAAFEIGTGYVPRDGIAYLHEGEAVIPAPTMDQLRGSDGAGDTFAVHQTNHYHGIADAQIKRYLQRNPGEVAHAMQKHIRQTGRG